MLHEYHVIYSVRCYPRFHVTAVGFGTQLYQLTWFITKMQCAYCAVRIESVNLLIQGNCNLFRAVSYCIIFDILTVVKTHGK
jgi:hypothetical protein